MHHAHPLIYLIGIMSIFGCVENEIYPLGNKKSEQLNLLP
jgi:hypothetical protein